MNRLRPRIYGWRMAAGVILWLVAVLVTVTQILGEVGGAGEGGWGEALAVPAALLVIAVGFWRGNRFGRWLGLVPAGLLLVAAAFTAGVVGVCVADDESQEASVVPLCIAEPRFEQLRTFWPITVGLTAAGLVVLVGVFLPGVREPEP